MTRVMYDSVNAQAFPPNGFDVTAGYLPGSGYPSSASIRVRFPNVPHLTITTTPRVNADCLDVEPRCATPAEAPVWFDRHPDNRVIYCPAGWTSQVRAAMGGRSYLLWSAHYTGTPHVCGPGVCSYPQADATQWFDKGPAGENVDQSLLTDHFYNRLFPTTGDDMPSSREVADAVWTHVLAVGEMRAPAGTFLTHIRAIQDSTPGQTANAVWDHSIARGEDVGPAAAWAWLADTRIIAGQLPEINARLSAIEAMLGRRGAAPVEDSEDDD